MNEDDLRRLSDEEFRRLQERIQERVPETTHAESLTYEQAANKLGVKYERVAALVSQGVLIAQKHPRDAKKYLGSDQVAWYDLVRQGTDDDLPNPALVAQEASRRAAQAQAQPRVFDTWTELRHYIEQHMAGSDVADQLTSVIAAVAQHIATALVRDVLGVEPLAAADRARLSALLAALTQKGRQTP
jgi:hypothetical protein